MNTAVLGQSLKIPVSKIFLFFLPLGVFCFSLLISPLYIEGDAVPYECAYKAVADQQLSLQGYIDWQWCISGEPGHYFIVWITNNIFGLEKHLAMSIANAILAYLVIRVFLNWGVSPYVSLVLVASNYYMFVLYFAAERLKFAFIFLLLALLYLQRRKLSAAFALTSVFMHAQQLIIYGALFCSSVFKTVSHSISSGKFGLKHILSLLVLAALALFVFYYLGEHILYKFSGYRDAVGGSLYVGIAKALVLLVLSLRYAWSSRRDVIVQFSFLLMMTGLVGPERLVMVCYALFLFYALQYRRGVNLGIAVTSLYFGLKSIEFIYNVFETGQGFSGY